MELLWYKYMERASVRNILLRSFLLIILFLSVTHTFFLMTEMPNVPFRGEVSFIADKVVIFSTVILLFSLLFITIDRTRLCMKWIKLFKDYV